MLFLKKSSTKIKVKVKMYYFFLKNMYFNISNYKRKVEYAKPSILYQ